MAIFGICNVVISDMVTFGSDCLKYVRSQCENSVTVLVLICREPWLYYLGLLFFSRTGPKQNKYDDTVLLKHPCHITSTKCLSRGLINLPLIAPITHKLIFNQFILIYKEILFVM